LNTTIQAAELLVIFSVSVNVMGVELQTNVPGDGFCVQVNPGAGLVLGL
jgi:hypothetical protein